MMTNPHGEFLTIVKLSLEKNIFSMNLYGNPLTLIYSSLESEMRKIAD